VRCNLRVAKLPELVRRPGDSAKQVGTFQGFACDRPVMCTKCEPCVLFSNRVSIDERGI
jgi:hypothetical protein